MVIKGKGLDMMEGSNNKPKIMSWNIPGGTVYKLHEAMFSSDHTLISGTTGSGKSDILNGFLCSFLRCYAPSEALLILIDPKGLDLQKFSKLPHCIGYSNTALESVRLLRNAVNTMRKRIQYCIQNRVKKYEGASIYIVIDELYPLMVSIYKDEIKKLLSLILLQGTYPKIHIIASTLLPNQTVLPNNAAAFSMRIGLSCVSDIESKQIIGRKGCENLPKNGKALVYYNSTVQEVDISKTNDNEVDQMIDYWMSDACKTYK